MNNSNTLLSCVEVPDTMKQLVADEARQHSWNSLTNAMHVKMVQ